MEYKENKKQAVLEYHENLLMHYKELQDLLSRVEVMSDNKLFMFYASQKKKIEDAVGLYEEYLDKQKEVESLQTLFNETSSVDEREEVLIEYYHAMEKYMSLQSELEDGYFNSKYDELQKACIEIACNDDYAVELFTTIFETYSKVQKYKNFKVTKTNEITNIWFDGVGAYAKIKSLSGNYKIKKSKEETDAKILIFSEKNTEIKFDIKDLKIETLKSSGAGGQHINKTESAVRVIHVPAGIAVKCQDERSQTQNKEKAIELIKEKILQKNTENIDKSIKNQRKNMQSAILSEKSAFVINVDDDSIICEHNKKMYNLSEIKKGKLSIISNDLMSV